MDYCQVPFFLFFWCLFSLLFKRFLCLPGRFLGLSRRGLVIAPKDALLPIYNHSLTYGLVPLGGCNTGK